MTVSEKKNPQCLGQNYWYSNILRCWNRKIEEQIQLSQHFEQKA